MPFPKMTMTGWKSRMWTFSLQKKKKRFLKEFVQLYNTPEQYRSGHQTRLSQAYTLTMFRNCA